MSSSAIASTVSLSGTKQLFRILLLQSNPSGTKSLRLDLESKDIERVISRNKNGPSSFELKPVPAAGVDDLEVHVDAFQPLVVIFSGQGEQDNMLFTDSHGDPEPASALQLQTYFESVSKTVKLVLLNACYSNDHAMAITQHVDFAVGVKSTINNREARSFCTSLLLGLLNGYSVGQAFRRARSRVSNPDGNVALHSRPGVDAETTFLTSAVHVGEVEPIPTASLPGGLAVSQDDPILLVPGVGVALFRQGVGKVEVPWVVTTKVEEIADDALAHAKPWQELVKTLHDVYVRVRDAQISVIFCALERRDEHRIHAQRVLNGVLRISSSIEQRIVELPQSIQQSDFGKVAIQLHGSLLVLKRVIGRDIDMQDAVGLAERLTCWTYECLLLSTNVHS